MKLKLTIAIILGLFFTRCNNDGEKTLNMSDIIGSSERYKEGRNTVFTEKKLDSTLVVKNWFVSQGAIITSLQFRSDRMFLDRFGAISTDKYMLITPVDTILYSKWIYEDSLKVMNAFTNWTSCIGDDCKTIFFGEATGFQQNPLQILMNNSTLILIEGTTKLDFKRWNTFHKVASTGSSWNYIIEQSYKGKARWYILSEGKRIKLEL